MRLAAMIVLSLALASCGGESEEARTAGLGPGLWTDETRGGLCVDEGGEAAFILYAETGNANCMAEGRIEVDGEGMTFLPRGDEQCRIPILAEGETLRFGDSGEACAYYCGSDVELGGQTVMRSEARPGTLTDVAGDPLC
ncbi:hypothetical protein [Sphingomicrobium nitratireducens]|uniref:hypothetical protein n=1 Tax=Sphingomicrobium nitratireducens TaxID=2964666 RepID=UPI00223ECF7E|nr:hypothetical protein [Sphingomicrobium nitratireducens]